MDSNNVTSARADEQLKHEVEGIIKASPVESRTEAKRQQAPGGDQPDMAPGRRPETAEVEADGLSIDDRHQRADFAGWFRPNGFPATGAEAVAMAEESVAPDWVTEFVSRLDPDERFDNVGQLWDAARRAE